MNNVPRLSGFTPHEPTAPTDDPPLSRRDAHRAQRAWLRPRVAEKIVLTADFLLIIATSLVCGYGYHWITNGDVTNAVSFMGIGVIVAVNFTAIMAARRNYRLKNLALSLRQARETIAVWSGVYGLLAAAGFAMKVSADFSRGATILFFVAGGLVLLCWRFYVASAISRSLRQGAFAEKKIIIIAEQDQELSSRPLMELKRHGYRPVATCQVSREEIASSGASLSLRAKLVKLIEVARSERIEDIYLLVGWNHRRAIDGILDALAVLPISVHLVPDEGAARFLSNPIVEIGSTWTAELRRAPLTRAELAAKRGFDLVLTSIALVMMLPLLLVTALLIKIDSRGPVLFVQKRNGFSGYAFNIFKFRTMHVHDDGPMVAQATRNDPRVTRLGRWLRRSSIDELPQLFNVLRGDMSLVGPRPHATSHNSEYEKLIANYAFRHHVRPGLTGWAQVKGYRGETRKIELMQRRVEHDLWYINNWSLLLDVRIVLETTLVALRQSTAY